MGPYLGWVIVLAVLIGHVGLNIAIYNRINAIALSRRTIKRIEKFFFVLMLVLPVAAVVFYGDVILDVLKGRPGELLIPWPLLAYSWFCLSTWVFLGIPWLLWRPIFGLEWIRVRRKVEVIDVQAVLAKPLALTRSCRLEACLPLNQIFELAIEELDLPVVGLPPSLDGYRIAQVSDVHLTGQIHPDFTSYAVEQANAWRPDLIVLTGDIIDKQSCIDWLEQIFSPARAPDGCFYVLGNHDTRIVDSRQTRQAMDQAGWTDLGSRCLQCRLRDEPTLVIGNEHPWYRRPTMNHADLPENGGPQFRLMLSHSPDQIWWARKHEVTLMLAGHTHGGQGRLPLAGPLLGPSFHGSRFASGDFYKPPTTMHVSRGLSGTHLMRINCRPELSLITLRQPRTDVVHT